MLGDMAQASSGEVTIVKPLELQRKMRQIIDNPIIATDVQVSPTTSSSSSTPSSAHCHLHGGAR